MSLHASHFFNQSKIEVLKSIRFFETNLLLILMVYRRGRLLFPMGLSFHWLVDYWGGDSRDLCAHKIWQELI